MVINPYFNFSCSSKDYVKLFYQRPETVHRVV
jgi:hypothetical protein